MVGRVVPLILAAMLAAPANAGSLPYNLDNLVPAQAQHPEIYYDVSGLLYDRTPDHLALGYRVDAISGGSATHRVVRDYGPLDYNTDGLLAVIIASIDRPAVVEPAD